MAASPMKNELVWDAPVRMAHWLIALCFFGAYFTAEEDSLRVVHVTLGYTLGGLVLFRLVWGLVGSHHARFASFVRGPAAAAGYLRSLLTGRPEHHTGHNPAGALAIVALLAGAIVLVLTGWLHYADYAGEWAEELHELIANAMMALVVVHIAAVLLSCWLHKENLVAAMFHGRKRAAQGEAIERPWNGLAVLLLAAVLAFWWWQWQYAPPPPPHGEHSHAEHD